MRSVNSKVYSIDECRQQIVEGGEEAGYISLITNFVNNQINMPEEMIRYITIQRYIDNNDLFNISIQFKQNPEIAEEE